MKKKKTDRYIVGLLDLETGYVKWISYWGTSGLIMWQKTDDRGQAMHFGRDTAIDVMYRLKFHFMGEVFITLD